MLECTKCHTDKDAEEDFYGTKAQNCVSRKGKTYWCKQCYAKNYEDNRERQLRSNERARIRRRYGLGVEEYRALLDNGCTACGPKARGRIVLDHCHVTEAVRAPLCDGCNKALGCVADDPEILRSLTAYLEQHATT